MIDLLEAYQPWSNPGRPPRVPLPAQAKKAGRRKLTRVDQRGLDDPRGRPMTTQDDPARVDQRGLGDPTSTRVTFSAGRILVFLKGFLDFLMETIRFSRDV